MPLSKETSIQRGRKVTKRIAEIGFPFQTLRLSHHSEESRKATEIWIQRMRNLKKRHPSINFQKAVLRCPLLDIQAKVK